MTQLVYRIKDLEAASKNGDGIDLDADLPREFFAAELSGLVSSPAKSSAHVKAHLKLLPGAHVVLRGRLTGSLAAECQRCLAQTQVPVDLPLHMTLVPADTALPGDDKTLIDPDDPDDVDYGHHDRESIDLLPIVREQLILALPITILCKEDCLGLCPVCAKDRNQHPCQCQQSVSLSPFAVLKDIKLNN